MSSVGNNTISSFFQNDIVNSVISLLLVLYGSLAKPELPDIVVKIFENSFFRVLVLSLVVYKGNKDPTLALMIAVVFVVVMNFLTVKKIKEKFMFEKMKL